MSENTTQTEVASTTPNTPVTEPSTAAPALENVVPFPTETSESGAPPLLVSRLIHVIGQFLSQHVDKPANEMSEELKHLFALFSQHIMLVNSINADPTLAGQVVAAVDSEIQRITEEAGGSRKTDPVPEAPSNLIVS